MILKRNLALFFMMFFIFIISAPTIIVSMDKSFDTEIFFDVNEEEEKGGLKLLFEITSQDIESFDLDVLNADRDEYNFKKYSNPHINLIFPPPDSTLTEIRS